MSPLFNPSTFKEDYRGAEGVVRSVAARVNEVRGRVIESVHGSMMVDCGLSV